MYCATLLDQTAAAAFANEAVQMWQFGKSVEVGAEAEEAVLSIRSTTSNELESLPHEHLVPVAIRHLTDSCDSGRGEEQLEKLGEDSQGKPRLEQGTLSEKLEFANQQAQIISADDTPGSGEQETQREHLVRHINQFTKPESPEPVTKVTSKGKGKAVACDWKGDPVEPQPDPPEIQYDDLSHEPAAKSQKQEGHSTQERTGGSTKGSAYNTNQPKQHQELLEDLVQEPTSKPAQSSTPMPAGVFAPRPTPASDKETNKKPSKDSGNDSTKKSTKDSGNDPTKKSFREFSLERFEKPSSSKGKNADKEPTKSGEQLPGELHVQARSKAPGHHKQPSAEDANSDKSTQGKGPDPQPKNTRNHHVCEYFHEHSPEASQDAGSEKHIFVLDPEPMADEPESTREKQKKDHEHAGHDEAIGVIHQADCEEHPEATEEHLVADNPRLGKMIAVYQKIEAKVGRSEEDKEKRAWAKSEAKEEKEQKERAKREAKEKKALERQERKEKRAQEKQERRAEREKQMRERRAAPGAQAAPGAPGARRNSSSMQRQIMERQMHANAAANATEITVANNTAKSTANAMSSVV
ncbi:uncharacterized protein PG986_005524 [Apiospora aurea]|uniref:Uncharacterized protein n=1 Tax=Apiospora aurea TaxID=335848 RepID=A0ABR1QHU0_9PEZI